MNLNNSLPVPAGLRRCFWDAEYISSEPFCVTSKLTADELISLAAFEELKFWERTESMKIELNAQAKNELAETLEEILNDDRGIDFDLAFSHMAEVEKRLDSITSNLGKDFFTNDNQKEHQKLVINRSDFLTR